MSRILDPWVLTIDVESTCWEPPEKPADGEFSEIIEIGIAVVNFKTLELGDNASILVRPQNSKISKFCTQLTTLTQDQVDRGLTFQEAMRELRTKFNCRNRLFVSWGDYDRKMFEKNCRDYQVEYPFGPRHLNLKNNFAIFHGLEKEIGVENALKHLKMEFKGTQHRGIDDSRNIARIFVDTLNRFRGQT